MSSTAAETKFPASGDTFCSVVTLPSDDDVRKGVKAGRKAAQGWQVRANEWRQRLVKKSSAIWRDRKNSIAQPPPVPVVPSLPGELLPAVDLAVGVQNATNAVDVVVSGGGGRPGPGIMASVGGNGERKLSEDEERGKKKVVGLRKVFSRAQLSTRGT